MKAQKIEETGIFRVPPLIYIVPFIVGLVLHFVVPLPFLPEGWIQLAIGLPIIFFATIFWLSALLTLRRAGTPVDPGKPVKTLVVTGPFRLSRNPLYLSLTVVYAGIALSMNALWPLIFLPLAVVLLDRWVVRQEERYLEKKFGSEYTSYKATVRRWL